MKKYFILIFLLVALQAFPANKNVIVKEYSIENGLPNNTVFSAMKDRDGLMWFGTWYGLSSFDGVKFRSYNSRDFFHTDIPPHKIQNIVEANDGNLWLKTIDHKLYIFDKKTEFYYDAFNEIKKERYSVSPKIIKIQKMDNGNLLLLTKDKDLLSAESLGNGKIKVNLIFDSQSGRNHKITTNTLAENANSISWIGMDFKIFSCPKGDILKKRPADFILRKISDDENQNYSCAFYVKNKMWVADDKGIIFKINLLNGNINKIENFKGMGKIDEMTLINEKTMLVAIAHKGIYEYNESTQTITKEFDLRPNDDVTHFFQDNYEKIWINVNESSIIYFDPFNDTHKRFDLPTGIINRTLSIVGGKELGVFIITTSGQLAWIDRSVSGITWMNDLPAFRQYNEKKTYFSMLLDKDNILWLTSTTQGVFRVSFPKQQFNLIRINSFGKSKQKDIAVKSIFQSRTGDIWVSTRQAEVYHLDKNMKLLQVFNKNNHYIGNVYHIMQDRDGNIWFSTKGDGLVLAKIDKHAPSGFDFERFTYNEKDPNSISGNEVYYTYQDSKGRIWVALFGGGLNLVKDVNGKISFYNKYNCFDNYPKYGLYMEVRNIVEGKNGRIWVGTSDGLMSFDGNFNQPNNIKFEIYRNKKSDTNISDNDIYVLFKDDSSHIWVSVFGGGLNKLIRYDKKTKLPVFKSYTLSDGLNSEVIVSIVEDDNKSLWLATENSISSFDTEKGTFRNYDKYDGFLNVQMEEASGCKLQSGDIWFGSRDGILDFNPKNIETYNCNYKTFIVGFLVNNRPINEFKNHPIIKGSIRYTSHITLQHNQSNFVIEFAALNYYNQNRVSYKYILENYDDDWHYNGKNRFASYPNVPPGKYIFKVKTVDEANDNLSSERTLHITILPPWWRTWWAYGIYSILAAIVIFFSIKAVLIYIKMRNEVYIEQRVSELKIRFFTNISHELRTPLTLIMGPIQELKQKQELTDKGKQYINLIEKSAKQMLQLVNQILDFRKIQNGKMTLHVSKLDLNALVNNFQKEFQVLAEENEISYSFQLSDEDIDVWADKDKLETVIRNIISNAFKFTKAGGSIFVSTSLSEDGEKCYISVEDTGVGIPQSKISEIFERFSQGENSKNPYYQGTGIGLALSKELMNLHHGDITVVGKSGIGSTFTIELLTGKTHFKPSEVEFYMSDNETVENPDDDNAHEEEIDEQALENSNLPTLLVVEDNKDMSELLKLQMEDRYNVIIARNGLEGLKKVNHYHPDIVVTDQMMPEMSGTEMLTHIREDFKISHIPVIILTAKGDEEAKIKAVSLGANAYITKPFNKEYLVACIEQLLNERKAFRERIWKMEEISEEQPSDSYETYLVKKDLQLLERINKVIEENIQNSDFNIDIIAETLGLSRSAFFKKLKSLTGLAPVDLIKEVRLNKSLDLLKNTDLTVSEIAFEVGFKEAGYFGKCFRKKYNQTPTEFMNIYRKS